MSNNSVASWLKWAKKQRIQISPGNASGKSATVKKIAKKLKVPVVTLPIEKTSVGSFLGTVRTGILKSFICGACVGSGLLEMFQGRCLCCKGKL